MKTFAERLRFARDLRRLTQAELARACKLSQGAIANYESGSRRDARGIFELATALRVSALWLAQGVGPMDYEAPALSASRLTTAESQVAMPVLDWPFKNISPEIYWSLTETDRELVENTLAGLIASLRKKT